MVNQQEIKSNQPLPQQQQTSDQQSSQHPGHPVAPISEARPPLPRSPIAKPAPPLPRSPIAMPTMSSSPIAKPAPPLPRSPIAMPTMSSSPIAKPTFWSSQIDKPAMPSSQIAKPAMPSSPVAKSPMVQSPMAQSPMPKSPMPKSPMPKSPMPKSPMPKSPMPKSPMPKSPMVRPEEVAVNGSQGKVEKKVFAETPKKAPKDDIDMEEEREERGVEKRPREYETKEEPEAKRAKVTTPEAAPKETRRRSTSETDEGATIIQGRGVRLGEIPNFVSNYGNIKPTTATVRKLYRALFSVAGRPQTRYSDILQWSGIPSDVPIDDLTARFNAACTAAELSEIGKKYFGLKSGAGGKNTKQAWCDSIIEIVSNPQPGKIELFSGGEGRGAAKGAGGYQRWCSEHREALKTQHPGLSHREFLKVLSEVWKNTSDEEKQNYVSSARKSASPKRGAKGKRKAKSETEDEMEETLETEEDEEEIIAK